jgi:hypothetical protein
LVVERGGELGVEWGKGRPKAGWRDFPVFMSCPPGEESEGVKVGEETRGYRMLECRRRKERLAEAQ